MNEVKNVSKIVKPTETLLVSDSMIGQESVNVAKEFNDKEIIRLGKKYGEIGSGYPSDPITRKFLYKWIKMNKKMPEFTRKSWKTWEAFQPKIEDYFE